MQVTSVPSLETLQKHLAGLEKAYVLLYKAGSAQSDEAFANFAQAAEKVEKMPIFSVNVATVRDVHTHYGIKTAPSLLEFQAGQLKNVIKGSQTAAYYQALLEEAVFAVEAKAEGKVQKNVTVYSTPTCPWCNVLKDYLRKNRIRFQDVDVSRDAQAAQELVRKSGQQGVPQTEIDGQIIVGFDKNKINTLLEIQG